jgi:hypothetical protein
MLNSRRRILRSAGGLLAAGALSGASEALAALCLVVARPSPARAQTEADAAIRFYTAGGSYCFRIAPSGVALAQETEWTVMLLTSTSNPKTSFRIRDVDPGRTGLSGAALAAAGVGVNSVWRSDRDRADFFDGFASGIEAGVLRARVVKAGPANLSQLKSDRERADVYLKFADRGSRVAFDKAPDLTPAQFRQFLDYLPD